MKVKSQFKYIFILHMVLMVYSFLGISSKLAAKYEFLSGKFIFFYAIVFLNLALYAIVWQQLLKKIPLITAYANKAVTVAWGIAWGYIFFREPITIRKIIGAIIIIIGVYIVVVSDKDEGEKRE